MSLTKQITSWVAGRNRSGKTGLVLMVNVIEHMGKERDWDKAAHMLHLLKDDSPSTVMFKRFIRAYFGDRVTLSKDDKHATGMRFKFKDKDVSVPKNTWAIVTAGKDAGLSYSSASLHKELKEALEGTNTPKAYDDEAAAKRLYKKLKAENIPIGRMITLLSKLEKEEKAEQSAVVTDIDNNPVANAAKGRVPRQQAA